MIKLCVNIDHVATIRQARGGVEPDPVSAAVLCELAGAHGITFHLREDRRHIQERDARLIKEMVTVKLNMEMANTDEMVSFAKRLMPHQITLVPEKRQELTTEGGLDAAGSVDSVKKTVKILGEAGIETSLFINPDEKQVDAAVRSGAFAVELHTGEFANSFAKESVKKELDRIISAAVYAGKQGLKVYAGHGLNYRNVKEICSVPEIEELNIGHSIISRSVFSGIGNAVKEMLYLIVG